MASRWTIEEENILKEAYPKDSKKDILIKINKSWNKIRQKASKLNLIRNKSLTKEDRSIRKARTDSWSPEELTLLKEIYPNNSKKFILSKIILN